MKNYILVFILLFYCIESSAQGFQWAHSSIAGKTVVDDTGNIYTLAWFDGTVDFDAGSSIYNLTAVGNSNMFLLKEDAAGNFLWVKQFGGPNGAQTDGIVAGGGIALDSNNNIYIGGNFKDSLDFDPSSAVYKMIGGVGSIFVLKLNSAGEFMWAKASTSTLPNFIWMNDMKLDAYANIYLACNIQATVDVDLGPDTVYVSSPAFNIANALIEKLDSAGSYIWAKNVEGQGSSIALSMDIDPLCNVYFTGTFTTTVDFDPAITTYNLTSLGASLYGTDSYVTKWDSVGTYIWAKQIGGPDLEVAEWITVDQWGNPTIAGYLNGTADFDPGASTYNLSALNGTSAFTCHLKNNGDFAWANMIESAEPRSIACDMAGNVYIAGSFYGADLDPGPNTYYIIGAGSQDAYVQTLDTAGDFKWAISFGSTSGDGAGWIDIDNQSNIYIAGGYSGFADFDPGAGTYYMSSGGGFKVKLCPFAPVLLEASALTGCYGLDTIMLSTAPLAGATYTWAHGGTIVQTGSSNTFGATESGYYEVTVTGLGCPATSNRVTLEFAPTFSTSISSVTLNTGPTSVPCWAHIAIQGLGFYSDGNNPAIPIPTPYQVEWFKNGVPFDTTYNSFSIVYIPSSAGNDTIKAILSVQSLPCAWPATGTFVLLVQPTGIEEVQGAGASIVIYPNPASGFFTASGIEAGSRLLLTDLSGRVLKQWSALSSLQSYDLDGIDTGYYMLRVEDKKGRLIATKKLIKQ